MDMTYPCWIEGVAWLARATEEGGEKKGMGPAACPSFGGTSDRTCALTANHHNQERKMRACRWWQHGRVAVVLLMANDMRVASASPHA